MIIKKVKKVNFIFFFQTLSLLMAKIMKKGLETSDQLLFRLKSQFRNIPLLVMYYLTKFDDGKEQFLSYSKNYIHYLCKPIHDIIKYSTFVCPFESGKFGKEGKKFAYLVNEKSFLDEIKSIFLSF